MQATVIGTFFAGLFLLVSSYFSFWSDSPQNAGAPLRRTAYLHWKSKGKVLIKEDTQAKMDDLGKATGDDAEAFSSGQDLKCG